jgi:hypothetical protein
MKVHAMKYLSASARGSWAAGAALCLVLLATGATAGAQQRSPAPPLIDRQQGPGGIPTDASSRRGGLDPTPDAMATRMGDQQARSRNADRQNRLEVDTKKLLSLATELKEQVDKTDKNVLSIDVIKKADEIERLAKSVKERMKG